MNLTAVYYASCKRELGVIVDVDSEKVTLLTLEGKFVSHSRFEILYLAYYPVGKLPLFEIHPSKELPPTSIITTYGRTTAELVTGWPIDFSEDQISFLTLVGENQVIDKSAIWDLEKLEDEKYHKISEKNPQKLNLIHPYPFAYCKADSKGAEIAPQQILGDPFLIKKELDRLGENFKEVKGYYRDKRFYAVPQLYTNRNSLGLWATMGNRYGTSQSRSNNFAPVFISELTEGPFSFQRVLVTGAGRMGYSLHEEPQNQFYYSMKADYVHFSVMYDLDRLLLGEERYKWQTDDLTTHDDRINELQHIAGGFDFGSWSFEFGWAPVQYAVQVEETFFRSRVDLNRNLIKYQNQNIKVEFYYGHFVDGKASDIVIRDSDSPEQVAEKERLLAELAAEADYLGELRFYRLNLYLWPEHFLNPEINLIHRQLTLERQADSTYLTNIDPEIRYFGKNSIVSLSLSYQAADDIMLKGFGSWEQSQKDWGETSLTMSETSNYFKLGTRVSLSF